ncbi:hypothetical protein [Pseudoalteromonas piscicida]|uniref:hypothetical protein n=1 Tax=Pseudoalteromonas piscicida TaxID=43662 RepID=UPI0005FA12DC|nr:hypothetical protein [Pseudoalteromonas piscicida]KJZ03820.1 hypothetical protein TW73_06145 [Pseudoalteromonas piscicida]
MKYIWLTCALATLLGCSDERYDEQQVAQQKKEISLQNELELVGAWESENLKIEFHGSHYNRVFPNQLVQQSQLKTGMYVSEGYSQKFHWSLDDSGIITINIIDGSCTIVPLEYCATTARKSIALTGELLGAAQWEIKSDNDLDGVVDEVVKTSLIRTVFGDLAALGDKLFFKQSGNFDNPLITTLSENQIIVTLPISAQSSHRYGKFIGDLSTEGHVLSLQVMDQDTITQAQWFKIPGESDRLLDVKTTISDVKLRKGVNAGYIIDYLVQRELSLPTDLTEAQVDLSEFITGQRHTMLFTEAVSLRDDIDINFGQTYYSKLPAGFAHSADGAGSEVIFNSDNTGVIAFTDPSGMTLNNEQPFTWNHKNDEEMEVKLDSGAVWSMGFTGSVLGGSSVIFYNEKNEIYGHDFLTSSYVEPSSLVPGRFKLENTDGLSLVDVDFKDNGEIDIKAGPISFSGFWVITNEGDVVSFECDKKDGAVVTELDSCLDHMSRIGTSENELKFGHIRKFTFLHSDNSELVSTYNATAWGEPFTTGEEPVHFNWVYRWKRLGDNHH